jgi:hypothetical protein
MCVTCATAGAHMGASAMLWEALRRHICRALWQLAGNSTAAAVVCIQTVLLFCYFPQQTPAHVYVAIDAAASCWRLLCCCLDVDAAAAFAVPVLLHCAPVHGATSFICCTSACMYMGATTLSLKRVVYGASCTLGALGACRNFPAAASAARPL